MKTLAKLLVPAGVLALGACSDDAPPPCEADAPGKICTIAGDGHNGYSGDDGPATEARLSLPQDVLRHPDGTLYILDWNNHRIRALPGDDPSTIRHIAGRGELGGTRDDPANSDLNHPTGLVLDPSGTRLIIAAWHNSKLRVIDLATLEISDSCGDGRRAYFGDGGPALTSSLDLPASLAYAPNGNLIIMDQANQVMRQVDPAGTISRYAGRCVIDAMPPMGGGKCAPGVQPIACPGGSGKFTCGALGTCAAPCTPGYEAEGASAMDLRMGQPFGQSADPAGRIVFDKAGNLYFADSGNHVIRKIDTQGMVTRIAGTAMTAGNAGDGGPAASAMLNNPVDLALGDDGTLYVTDVYNHCVRAITPNGTISTVAGICGTSGYDGDGGAASAAHLRRPYGIELADGMLYIADTGNHAIRVMKL